MAKDKKNKKQKDKQRSTKHTHKTKDRVTRTPPNTLHYIVEKVIYGQTDIYSVCQ